MTHPDDTRPESALARFRVALQRDGIGPDASIAGTADAAADGAVAHGEIANEKVPALLAAAGAQALGVDAAGLSVLDDRFRVPLAGSDGQAEVAERLQFTQGEGPCLSAATQRRPLAAGSKALSERWPMFTRELFEQTDYRAVLSVPLILEDGTHCALDVYFEDERRLDDIRFADIVVVGDEIAAALMRFGRKPADVASDEGSHRSPWLEPPSARRRAGVWVASGILMKSFTIGADDALALLRSYAVGEGLDVDTAAHKLVSGEVDPHDLQP